MLAELPVPESKPDASDVRPLWVCWQAELKAHFTLPEKLPRLQMLLILDSLTGH